MIIVTITWTVHKLRLGTEIGEKKYFCFLCEMSFRLMWVIYHFPFSFIVFFWWIINPNLDCYYYYLMQQLLSINTINNSKQSLSDAIDCWALSQYTRCFMILARTCLIITNKKNSEKLSLAKIKRNAIEVNKIEKLLAIAIIQRYWLAYWY